MRFVTITLCILLAACSPSGNEKNASAKTATYKGDFGGSGEIELVLETFQDGKLTGHNVHKGLTTAFNGTYEPLANGYHLHIQEEGDNSYVGQFHCDMDTVSHTISGSWTPDHNEDLKTTTFVLTKQ